MIAPPLALYVHFPWCVKKCPYCDFNSHSLKSDLPEASYTEQLIEDLKDELAQPACRDRPIVSIFFGGGTPSLFKPKSFQAILATLKERHALSPNLEVTLEVNPGASEHSAFPAYREAGINRISLGVQSFQADKLKALGRIHDPDEVFSAVSAIKAAQFDSFNIDLMYGLPQQTQADALFDLKQALSLDAPHLSWYHLTLEPHTAFFHKPPKLPAADSIADFQEAGDRLIQSQLTAYEIAAYARAEHQCQHNLNYWRFGDYLGIGAGSHGKLTDVSKNEIMRSVKHMHPKRYMDTSQARLASQTPLLDRDLPFEFMLNALRLKEPLNLDLFEARTGLCKSELTSPLIKAQDLGFITWHGSHVQVLARGMHFHNDLLSLFLPAA